VISGRAKERMGEWEGGVSKRGEKETRRRSKKRGEVERTVVGHGKNRDLSDRSVPSLNSSSSLVDGSQISVHVT